MRERWAASFSRSGRRSSTLSHWSFFRSSTRRLLLRARESRIRCPRPSASARDRRPSSRSHTCCLACCSSTWMERLGIAALRRSSSHRSNSGPALGRHPIHRSHQLGMLKQVQLQRQAGPQRRADRHHGPEPLAQRRSTQLRVDALFQIADPTSNGGVGAEQPPSEKRRVRHPQLLGVKLGFPAQPRIGRVLELLVAEQPRFQRAEDAGAEPLEVLIETPALEVLDLPRATASGV